MFIRTDGVQLAAEGAVEEIADAGDQFAIGAARLSVLYPLVENQRAVRMCAILPPQGGYSDT